MARRLRPDTRQLYTGSSLPELNWPFSNVMAKVRMCHSTCEKSYLSRRRVARAAPCDKNKNKNSTPVRKAPTEIGANRQRPVTLGSHLLCPRLSSEHLLFSASFCFPL